MQEFAQEKEELVATGDWVDLGLPSGLLWATRNVGATSPEDYGDYFAWGETQPKEFYAWSTYLYTNDSYHQLTKYCDKSYYGNNGFTDNLTTLQSGDDVANVNWVGGARIPTKEEWKELIYHTTAQWTTRSGVNGLLLIGSNGNSLFLPAAGHRRDSSLYCAGSYGFYWSSSLNTTGGPNFAWDFFFHSIRQYIQNDSRYRGFPVRAVRQN